MIIATAILMAAAITMAQLSFVTSKNAKRAEDRTIAQQIAAHQMQQIVAGLIPATNSPPQAIFETTMTAVDTTASQPHLWDNWQYSITSQPGKVPGTLQVQVNVFRMPSDQTGNDNLAANASSGNTSIASNQNNAANSNTASLGAQSNLNSANQVPDALFQYSLSRLVYLGDSSGSPISQTRPNDLFDVNF